MRGTLTHLLGAGNGENHAYRLLPAFMAGVLGVGTLRFVLSLPGVDVGLARYASMTAVILAGTVHFALATRNRRQRFVVAYFLILPYMMVETVGLGFTLWTGRPTIFHTEPYTLGTSIAVHFWGHIVGGLTWEPLLVFLLISGLSRIFGRFGTAGSSPA